MSEHQISLADAALLTTRARQSQPLGDLKAWWFNRDIFDMILAQPGAAGVRIYLGQKENGEVTPVLVGTDNDENDMASEVLGEEGIPCPPRCPVGSPLNGPSN